jgi:hypothetical protein
MRHFTLITALLCSLYSFAQNGNTPLDVKLPAIIPPSPEAAAINKSSDLSVSMYTGAATARIPLYHIKAGKLNLPLELSYNSNGTKVDEIPGRTGLNWSMAPGVITRMVHGEPDDQTTRLAPPADLTQNTQTVLNYLNQISSDDPAFDYDSDPDEYRFSGPGIGGKFICDLNWNAIQIPYSNVKIQVLRNNAINGVDINGVDINGVATINGVDKIIITNTDGIRYFYGGAGATETTISHSFLNSLNGPLHTKQNIKTAFFLYRIEYPSGDYIQLNYSPITIQTQPGFAETAIRHSSSVLTCGIIKSADSMIRTAVSCPGPGTQVSSQVTRVDYATAYLSSITTSTGLLVSLLYEARPDGSGDNRLQQLLIYNSAGRLIKHYGLSYTTPATKGYGIAAIDGDMNRRFFLQAVKEIAPGDTTALTTRLDYEDIEGLPRRLGYAQDYFGFYNGALNSTLLTAPPSESDWGQLINANRNPDAAYARRGMLKRITHPTGGYDEFDYEANTISSNEKINTTLTATTGGSGTGGNNPLVFYTTGIVVKRGHTARLNMEACANPGANTPATPNGIDKIAEIKVSTSLGSVIFTRPMYGYIGELHDIPLLPGNTYTVQLTVWGQANAARADLRYDSAATDLYGWVNKATGGVRIKSISSYDPLSNKNVTRYYRYDKPDSSGRSSGLGVYQPAWRSGGTSSLRCFNVNNGIVQYLNYYILCNYAVISSNTALPLYFYDNSHIGYQTVTESDDPAYKNGRILHCFSIQQTPAIGIALRGDPITNLPAPTYTTLNGMENTTKVYHANGLLLKEERKYYNLDSAVNIRFQGISARKKFTYDNLDGQVNADDFLPFDVSAYQYISSWQRMDSSLTIDYDPRTGRAMSSKNAYFYGSAANILPTAIETTGGMDEPVRAEKKYPNDMTGSVYAKMVAANMLSPVIEQTVTRSGAPQFRTITTYRDWWGDGRLLEPELIQTSGGNGPLLTRLRNLAYDSSGNLGATAKENDIALSYIYDYKSSYPVAEVSGAGPADIAFTGFEAEGKGGWAFSGTPLADSTTPGGRKVYALSSGPVTRTGLAPEKTYTLSYWSKNGAALINGAPAARTVKSSGGWVCYEHTVFGTSAVTLSGAATIDELRLHPKGSFMTSYNYEPGIGMLTACAPNYFFTLYGYDGFGRMQTLSDASRRIVKAYEYRYGQAITPCAGNTPDWRATGSLRCTKTADHTNNNTGMQEAEQTDRNNCSPTYLQTRWVAVSNPAACPVTAACTGADKRVVNGVCETGQRILVSSTPTSPRKWECVWYYRWSDGYAGPAFTEVSATGCTTD